MKELKKFMKIKAVKLVLLFIIIGMLVVNLGSIAYYIFIGAVVVFFGIMGYSYYKIKTSGEE